jgi:hypothetical protein
MGKSNENSFYAFLRNRLLAETSDFPLFVAKRFWARIPFGNKRVRFYHLYSEFLSVTGSNPTLSAISVKGESERTKSLISLPLEFMVSVLMAAVRGCERKG